MIKYDKLKNIDVEEENFDFSCPNCKADGMKKGVFEIKPIGISWKPDLIDNSDIKNDVIRQKLDELPTLRESLEKAIKEDLDARNISIYCNSCNFDISFHEKLNPSDLKKWMNKHLPKYMDLRIK